MVKPWLQCQQICTDFCQPSSHAAMNKFANEKKLPG